MSSLENLDQDNELLLVPAQDLDVSGNTVDIVVQGWNHATDYANAAFNGAQAHIGRLTAIGEATAELPGVELELEPLTATLAAFVMPTAPDAPDGLSMVLPETPQAPTLGAVAALDAGVAPVFDAVLPSINLDIARPVAPVLNLPDAPELLTTVLPEAPAITGLESVALIEPGEVPSFDAQRPEIDLAIDRPAALSAALPAAPAITELALPDAPAGLTVGAVDALEAIAAPEFIATLPTIDLDIARPGAFSATLPSAPVIADTVMPDAPAELAVGSVDALVPGEAPVFTQTAPVLDLAIARPQGLTVTLPDAPVVRDLPIPDAPLPPELDAVSPLSLGAAPEFTAVEPVLDLAIAKPDRLSVVAPVAPVVAEVAIPTAADLVLPDVPTLAELVIPPAPVLALPAFTATLGDAPTVPQVEFSFAEATYTSGLLDDLRTQLHAWVNGAATGLSPAVEDAIWNRMRDREQQAAALGTDEVLRTFSVRGFSRPPGAVSIALQRMQQKLNDNLVTSSREIAIKQADLEQSNRRFAIETAWGVESGLINYTSQIAGRALDAAKFAATIGLEVFRAEVMRYQADVSAFLARADVFKTLVQAELASLEVFKAQIEAQKLVGQINTQQVQLYTARVDAATSVIEMFKARIQAAQANADVQKTRIQAFGAEVQAYGEQVRAKASEYDAYATEVKAEVSKAETFKVQADAFSSRIQGFSAVLNARTAEKTSEVDIRQRLPIEMFKARTEGFRNVVQALEAASQVDRTRVQAYSAEVAAQGELTRARALDVDIFKASIEAERTKAEVFRVEVDAHKARVDAFVATLNGAIAAKNLDIKLQTEVPIEVNKARTATFEAMVRAAQAVSELQRTRVQAYSAEVDAFGKSIQAAGLDVDVYRANIDAEKGKADVYRIQTEAYRGRVDAFKAINDAAIAAKNIEVKLSTEVPIEVNKAQIALYEAAIRASAAMADVQRTRVQAYQAEVGAFGEQVRARATDVDAYKVEVEAERAKADVYRIDTDAYKARVDAFDSLVRAMVASKTSEIEVTQRMPLELLKTQVDAYRASLSGADTLSRMEGVKVDRYRAQLDGVGKQIQAAALDVDIYKASIDGERGRADVYKVQADAFNATVQAFRARVDALVAETNSQIKVNQELPLELYKAQAQGYETVVKAEGERVRALANVYETDGRLFESQVRGESARVGADADVYKASTERETKVGELRLKAAELNLDRSRQQIALLVEAVKAGAQVAAQLASSALSAINLSGGLHASQSASTSNSTSNSASNSFGINVSKSHNTNVNVTN